MVVGYRVCLTSRPNEPMLSATSPRLGPVNRAGHEVSWNAAGNPFKNGEPELRTWSVDAACLPRRRKDPVGSFISDDAAGRGRPRIEVRALDVDDHVRRAHSEPPKATRTRSEVELAMQTFGIYSDVDSFAVRRRVQAETLPPTKAMIGRTAMEFTDITSVLRRRTFHDAAPPGSTLSPRMAAKVLESIDIDSYYGRRRSMSCELSSRSAPWLCASFDGLVSDSPRQTRCHFFEHSLSADRYASLIGRPHFRSKAELAEVPAGNAEMQRIEDMERGWQRNDIVQATAHPYATSKTETDQFHPYCKNTTSYDSMSTASSVYSSLQSVPESEQEDWCSLSDIVEDERDNFDTALTQDKQVLPADTPLGLRRVLSSLSKVEMTSLLHEQGSVVEKLRFSLTRMPREPLKISRTRTKHRSVSTMSPAYPCASAVDPFSAVGSLVNQTELSKKARSKLQKDVHSLLKKAYGTPCLAYMVC